MKRLIPIIIYIVIAAMLGCQRHSNEGKLLDMAEAMLEEHPDSALAMLNDYADSIQTASEQDRMYYDLLLTTARDKCYITHTSDSLMRKVVEYYESNEQYGKLADAYRIMGRVYDDMHNAPTALEYYQKAVDKYANTGNNKQQSLTYDHIGVLCFEQHLPRDCARAFMKSYDYAAKSKCKSLILAEMRNLGRVYTILDNVDSALYYYNKAFDMGDKKFKKKFVAGELASIYLQLEDYANARRFLSYDFDAYSLWASYYKAVGKEDSAIAYYNKVLANGNIYEKEEACRNISEYEYRSGNLAAAYSNLKKSRLYNDTIFEEVKAAEVKEVEAKYNYEKIEAERNQLAFDKKIQLFFIVVLIIVVLLLVVIGLAIYNKVKHKAEYSNDQTKRTAYLSETKPTNQPVSLEQLPLYQTIKEHSSDESYVLSESQWDELFAETNLRFHDFTIRLKTLYPRIREVELVVCCLIKFGITNTQISTMLCKSISAISNLRKRLYEKIHGKKGSSYDFDDFIRKM